MPVDFGSCLHAPPTVREPAILERRAAEFRAARPGEAWLPIPDGTALGIGGEAWLVQTGAPDGVAVALDGRAVRARVASGERAGFDAPDRIRAELCGSRRYGRGEPIALRATVRVEAGARIAGTEWCVIAQIHQADTRRADGRFVVASPIFALNLAPGPDGAPRLQVKGETGRGVPAPGTFSPIRLLAEAPFALGVDHALAFLVVDGHGSGGRVRVVLDGRVLLDRADVDVGYEYVDLLADALRPAKADASQAGTSPGAAAEGRQSAGSYLKLGVYAGAAGGAPAGTAVAVTYRDVAVDPGIDPGIGPVGR